MTFEISKHAYLRKRNRAASQYDRYAEIPNEIAARLIERLDYTKIAPKRILDLGCATGYTTQILKKRFPKANIIALDPAYKMGQCVKKKRSWFSHIRPISAWFDQLPFAIQSFDLIVSNLNLQWQPNWQAMAIELHRVLTPNGLLLFSVPGPDTLKELRAAWATIDDLIHVLPFVDMHDIGDSLLAQSFDDPVVDMEMLSITYPTANHLFVELNQLGCRNLLHSHQKHLTTKQTLQALILALKEPLDMTFEVIYGQAWKPELQSSAKLSAAGEASIPVSAIKRR